MRLLRCFVLLRLAFLGDSKAEPREFKATFSPFCDPGRYKLLQECMDCAAGKFNDLFGQTACKRCYPGKFSAMSGQTACALCTAGKWNDKSDAATCAHCKPGKYNSDFAQTACRECDPGKFSVTPGQSDCELCKAGKWNVNVGDTACSYCSAGKYNNDFALTACRECDPGKFSAIDGQDQCVPCQPGKYNNVPGQSDCEAAQFPWYVVIYPHGLLVTESLDFQSRELRKLKKGEQFQVIEMVPYLQGRMRARIVPEGWVTITDESQFRATKVALGSHTLLEEISDGKKDAMQPFGQIHHFVPPNEGFHSPEAINLAGHHVALKMTMPPRITSPLHKVAIDTDGRIKYITILAVLVAVLVVVCFLGFGLLWLRSRKRRVAEADVPLREAGDFSDFEDAPNQPAVKTWFRSARLQQQPWVERQRLANSIETPLEVLPCE